MSSEVSKATALYGFDLWGWGAFFSTFSQHTGFSCYLLLLVFPREVHHHILIASYCLGPGCSLGSNHSELAICKAFFSTFAHLILTPVQMRHRFYNVSSGWCQEWPQPLLSSFSSSWPPRHTWFNQYAPPSLSEQHSLGNLHFSPTRLSSECVFKYLILWVNSSVSSGSGWTVVYAETRRRRQSSTQNKTNTFTLLLW